MNYFLGIDVSKSTLDLALARNGTIIKEVRISNDVNSIKEFLKELKHDEIPMNQLVVCLEHTGIYGMLVLELFFKKKVKICLERALHIKQSQGMTRGKSDKIDARRIVMYAMKNHQELTYWSPPRPVIQRLRALLALRNRLIQAKTQLDVPLKEAKGFLSSALVRSLQSLNQHALKGIARDLLLVEKKLQELLQEDELINKQFKHITSVPGVGPVTAMHLIVCTGEFKRITEAKKFACYAGVAPFEHSSGSSIRGKTRVSKMANMNMKRLLHMSAMSAIRCSDEIRQFYDRKVTEGKNKMSVLNAVRNKLISRVFACVINQRPFEKNYKHALA